MERRTRNALYARILAIGLGLSVLVHAALLGFGHLNFLKHSAVDAPLNVVTLPEPAEQPEERPERAAEEWQLALDLSETQLATVLELSEYQDVLAAAAATDRLAPVVPRPRHTVHMLESGFTPLRVPRPDRLTRRGGSVSTGPGLGRGGVIIIIGRGGMGPIDDCTPSGIGGRIPEGRIPIGERLHELGLRPPR